MADVYNDHYWQSEFAVAQADMDRLEAHIAETGQAYELEALAKRIIRGRLQYGAEVSPTALGVKTALADQSVRLWDPYAEWQVGDQVVLWTWSYARRANEVKIGEVVGYDELRVRVLVEDSVYRERSLQRAVADPQKAERWRRTVEEAVARLRRAQTMDEWTELIALEHGDRVASQLLDALRADERFVRLAGGWFLHRLAVPPSEEQLAALAWAMLSLDEPQPTQDLLSLLDPPVTEGDAGLFGLYLGMRDRTDLFANADPGQRPRWVLAGPPPGPVVARYATYDPDTHCVLCEQGEAVGENVGQRLWKLNLFRVVCTQMKPQKLFGKLDDNRSTTRISHGLHG
jgi:hypothetical protein